MTSPITAVVSNEDWHYSPLTVVVIGASGDLAKKKTYPSLLSLYAGGLLPKEVQVRGYARSAKTNGQFRDGLRPYLEKTANEKGVGMEVLEGFLEKCFYANGGSYDDLEAFERLEGDIRGFEEEASIAEPPILFNLGFESTNNSQSQVPSPTPKCCNRLFYFAIPANVFASAGNAIKSKCMSKGDGWTRIIVEKPFGHDLDSCNELTQALAKNFDESHLYRIDHYLGKEMVQNLMIMRFGNVWFERLWSRTDVAAVLLTFKEPFGTDGRGGYFDKYGIIRDILQNHLLQVLTLVCMEPPGKVDGEDGGEDIRNCKVNVLKCIPEIKIEDCALDERKAEVRIQFKDAPAAEFMFDSPCPRNELVIRLQPREAIYMKTNVKTPGFSSQPIQSELEVDYISRFNNERAPDAYTRLILDVLRGRTAGFVRNDELVESWKIFTPLLHKIEKEKVPPLVYKKGTRGPQVQDEVVERWGYIRNAEYVYYNGKVLPKSKI
ncbi:hypothetical protein TrRE_jg2181 [Triparma retinervis]|uniref:glucose-6-phosphate dehydrogenase (NADP(+)) n=1 Tax=Triparma retinervis TaxID=2557542 RepID=A0A9W7CKZ6_9STRA|nr:hypothetical protein TrRE_jg2181 [Triparma retinervis]